MTRRHGRIATLAAFLAVLAWSAADDVPAASGTTTCAYVEAGGPGPSGNVLVINSGSTWPDTDVRLHRDGPSLRIFVGRQRVVREVSCSGGQATVFNIDQVRLVAEADAVVPWRAVILDQSGQALTEEGGGVVAGPSGGGPFAPGATPEPQGSEIEISIQVPGGVPRREPILWRVVHRGGEAEEEVTAGRVGDSRVGINLNVAVDRRAPDVDVVAPLGFTIAMNGGDGADRLSGDGGFGFSPDPPRLTKLVGGNGRDLLVGNDLRNRFSGGPGADTIRAREGNDHVLGDEGRDRLFGGAGRDSLFGFSGFDRYFGGGGGDYVYARDGAGDAIDCGRGTDWVEIDRFLDELVRCP